MFEILDGQRLWQFPGVTHVSCVLGRWWHGPGLSWRVENRWDVAFDPGPMSNADWQRFYYYDLQVTNNQCLLDRCLVDNADPYLLVPMLLRKQAMMAEIMEDRERKRRRAADEHARFKAMTVLFDARCRRMKREFADREFSQFIKTHEGYKLYWAYRYLADNPTVELDMECVDWRLKAQGDMWLSVHRSMQAPHSYWPHVDRLTQALNALARPRVHQCVPRRKQG